MKKLAIGRAWVPISGLVPGFFVAVLVFGLGLALPGPTWSQAATATVQGYVYDPSEAVIAGASVQIVNPATGLARATTTDAKGYYIFAQLPAGTYELTFKHTGFSEYKRSNVVLKVGDEASINIHLQVAGVQAEVVVTEAAPVLEPTKTTLGTVVDKNMVENLPLNGRNWPELVLLTPGVTNDGDFGQVTFAGVSGEYNNIQVDGADNNNAFFGEIRGRTRAVFQFSQETIQEFRVANLNYTAEFGRAGGGIVNAITKSGTNSLHGGVWYYFRDDGLNAQDPISKGEITVNSAGEIGAFIHQPPERRQQYGFNIGGPIVKDRAFFFFNLDNQKRNEPRIMVLGDLGNEIVGLLNSSNAREQGLGLLAINYFGPLVRPIPRTFNQQNYFPRLDVLLNDNNTLSFTHNFQRWRSQNGVFTTVTSDDNISAEALNSTNSYTNNLTLNSVLTPNLLNEFRFQFTWDNVADRANDPLTPDVRLRGVRFGGADFLQSVPGQFPGRFTKERRLQWTDNLTFTHGRHTFKTGVDINRVVDRNFFAQRAAGSYSVRFRNVGSGTSFTLSGGYFNGCIDFATYDAAITGGSSVADALAAALTPANCATVLSNFQQRFFSFTPLLRQRNIDYGLYAQDKIRATRRLTLYGGIRYEFQDLPSVCGTLGISLTSGTCVVNPLEPRTGVIPQDKNNIMPRVGFAWEPADNWVVRGGYGIFFIRTPSEQTNNALTDNNFFSFNQFISCSSSAAPACGFSAPTDALIFPNPLTQIDPLNPGGTDFPILAAPTSACPSPPACSDPFGDIFVFAGDRRFGYVQQGSFEIERQLGANTTIAASWIWSHGVHLDRIRNSNVAPVDSTCPTLSFTCAEIDVLDPTGTNVVQQFFVTRYGATSFSQRPNSDFRQILTYESSGTSNYNGFGLRVQHRFSHGFSLLSSYTLSKNIDTVRDSVGFFSSVFDPFNTRLDRGLSDLDQRQRWVTSWVYEPQAGRNSDNAAVRWIAANWRFTGIFTAASGRPVTPGVSGGSTDSDFNEDNVIFDRVPFLGRNTFRGPGRAVLDFGVTKLLPFSETVRGELIFQAFNLFNTPVFTFFDNDLFTSDRSGGASSRVFSLTPNPSFLSPGGSLRGRDIQLGFRLTF